MKDCTTCKYGYEDERLGIPMCHHPKRFSEDCVNFNMHEEKDIKESEKPMELEKMEREEELKKAIHQVSEEIVKEIFPDGLENGDFFTEIDLKNCITRVAYQFADWQKEQMMKGAVEGRIEEVSFNNGELHNTIFFAFDEESLHVENRIWVPRCGKDGDKVRIIIVKEDEK